MIRKIIRNKIVLLASLGLLLLAACAPPLPPADPDRAEKLRSEGLRYDLKHDFASAAERYREATLYDPLNSSAYLNQAELLDAIEQPRAAYDAYQQALRYLPGDHPDREFIIYRSALLLAAKLDKPGKAEDSLVDIKTPELKSDLTGVIALNRDDPHQALQHFQDALRNDMEKDRYSRIYFHIAQTYLQLNDEDLSRDALLISVEKAYSRALKEDIRRFFEALINK